MLKNDSKTKNRKATQRVWLPLQRIVMRFLKTILIVVLFAAMFPFLLMLIFYEGIVEKTDLGEIADLWGIVFRFGKDKNV